MQMTERFPTTPGELTAAWLTGVLQTSGVLDSGAVAAFTWALVGDQGGAGVVGRATLEFDRLAPGAPATVVIKFATPHAPTRALMHRFGLYRTEVEFYRQLGADAGIPTPRCYFADVDAESGFFALVMEDMRDARLGDPLRLTVPDIEVAIDHIAGFHARWWKHPRLRDMDWLAYPEGPEFETRAARLQVTFAGAVAATRQRLGDTFPAVLSEACDRILAGWPAYVASRVPPAPTLVHRDFHAQQLFFPSERAAAPVPLLLIRPPTPRCYPVDAAVP